MTHLYLYSEVKKNEFVPSPVMPFVCCSVDMERRDLSHKEKLYLREQNVITETQCTLGKNQTSDTLKPVKLFHSTEPKLYIFSVQYIDSLVPCL